MPKKLDRVNFTSLSGSEQAITGRTLRGRECCYHVGYTDKGGQPSIAVHVDGHTKFSQIAFDYDVASLKAAKLLVKEIKRGIKEQLDA